MRVTVVPSDNIIILDGAALRFDYPAPANLHALQWQGDPENGSGHLEFTDDYNMELGPLLFAEEVQPFIDLWNEEKKRLDADIARTEEEWLAAYNSEQARFTRLREERDRRIAATDYLLMSDYPLDADAKAAVEGYRQALRDLPAQESAPWDGGGRATPWPELPSVSVAKA